MADALDRLLKHRICHHVFTQGPDDEYGNEDGTFAPELEAPAYTTRAFLGQVNSRERRPEGGYTVVKVWKVVVGPETEIKHRDRITWQGRQFKVEAVLEGLAPRGLVIRECTLMEVP